MDQWIDRQNDLDSHEHAKKKEQESLNMNRSYVKTITEQVVCCFSICHDGGEKMLYNGKEKRDKDRTQDRKENTTDKIAKFILVKT